MTKSMLGVPKLLQYLTDCEEVLGSKWNQTWHKAESLQMCGAANTIIGVWNLYSLPVACQKPEQFLYKLS